MTTPTDNDTHGTSGIVKTTIGYGLFLIVWGGIFSIGSKSFTSWIPSIIGAPVFLAGLLAWKMPEKKKKDSRLERAGVSGYNKPKRTPSHPKKSHIVVAKEGDKIKTIRFGQQGVKTAGKPKKGESAKQKARRKSFKARHSKNIAKGKMSAAYWADKVKW